MHELNTPSQTLYFVLVPQESQPFSVWFPWGLVGNAITWLQAKNNSDRNSIIDHTSSYSPASTACGICEGNLDMLPGMCVSLPSLLTRIYCTWYNASPSATFWTSRGGLGCLAFSPPGTCLRFYRASGFSISTTRRFSSNFANSRSPRAFRFCRGMVRLNIFFTAAALQYILLYVHISLQVVWCAGLLMFRLRVQCVWHCMAKQTLLPLLYVRVRIPLLRLAYVPIPYSLRLALHGQINLTAFALCISVLWIVTTELVSTRRRHERWLCLMYMGRKISLM